MYVDIVGYTIFQMYIRSYAESNYDYVMVSQLDQTINNSSSYTDTTLVKAHTRGTQKSGTTISDYTLVEFTGLDGGEHRITVVYRKDSSGNSGTDKGYILIPHPPKKDDTTEGGEVTNPDEGENGGSNPGNGSGSGDIITFSVDRERLEALDGMT